MKQIEIGSKKTFNRLVEEAHIAQFDSGQVHRVCSTFQIAKDAEWVCRLFVLDMLEEGEEGIGTYLEIEHVSPALIDQTILYSARLVELNKNEVVAKWEARIDDRLVANGKQIQKILPKVKIDAIFDRLK